MYSGVVQCTLVNKRYVSMPLDKGHVIHFRSWFYTIGGIIWTCNRVSAQKSLKTSLRDFAGLMTRVVWKRENRKNPDFYEGFMIFLFPNATFLAFLSDKHSKIPVVIHYSSLKILHCVFLKSRFYHECLAHLALKECLLIVFP